MFPCRPGEKGPCYARGTLEHGHNDATTDKSRITAWLNRWPEANVAIPTGRPSGIVSLDMDTYKSGAWTPGDVERELGPLPATRLVRTGRGGLQALYLRPEGELRNGIPEDVLGPGVCVKADGGYVLVPPSVTDDPYEVIEDAPLAECPGWLAEALRDTEGVIVPKGAYQPARRRAFAGSEAGGKPAPAPLGRNVALTSICGSLHDGTRDLPTLTAALAAVRDEEWPDFPDAEVAKIARSIHRREPCKPQGKRAPAEVQQLLLAFEHKIEAMSWPGHASNRLSQLKTYILEARKHGVVHEGGAALSIANSQTALHNGISPRSVRRNNAKLVEEGVIATDNGGGTHTESGTIVLLVDLSDLRDNLTTPRSVPPHTHKVSLGGEGKGHASGGGGDTSGRLAKWSAVRARHGKPLYDGPERVGFLPRFGKRGEQAVDELEGAGGKLTPEDLAAAMDITKVRNMFREFGWLWKLLDAGVVERDDAGYLHLTDEWLEAWDRRRILDEEEMDRERDRGRNKEASAARAHWVAEHAEELHQKRLRRIELECFDGVDPETGEIVAERRDVPEPVDQENGEKVDESDDEGAESAGTGTEGSHEASVPVAEPQGVSEEPQVGHTALGTQKGLRPATPPPRYSGDDLSDLARALSRWLDRNPGDHPERKPPGDRRMQTSWLGSTVWAHEPGRKMPEVSEVAAALSELERVGRKEAA